MQLRGLIASLVTGAVSIAGSGATGADDARLPDASLPRIENALPWRGAGVWLSGDPHCHYLMRPDRGATIARKAAAARLDFLASTEHAEDLSAEDTRRLGELRREHSELILMAGAEWNMPGAGHASILVGDGPGELELLLEFARRFDRKVHPELVAEDPDVDGKTWGELRQSAAGLRWLAEAGRKGPATAVLVNHPTKDSKLDLAGWRLLLDAGLAGLEAAPGHQNRNHPGEDYTLDRHEPLVVRVGDDYDRLLAAGHPVALATGSDFHVSRTSFYPGFFARTFVYAPERSAEGVVRGIAAGATATVHGNLLAAVETRLTTPELEDHAAIGETLVVATGTELTYSLIANVRAVGRGPGRGLHEVEFVSDFPGEPKVVETRDSIGLGRVRLDYRLPAAATSSPRSFYLRARGRQRVGGAGHDRSNADLLFHIAATRVVVVARPQEPPSAP